jgi:di/tripeptidase
MTGPASARELTPTVIRRTIELAEIPAPTGAEQARADLVLRWWDTDGWAPHTDAVGNVWGQVADGPGPGLHEFSAASTDANAALSAGIPAVTPGVTRGEREHTPGEWIETAPITDGLTALADTIHLLREGQA